MDVDDDSGEEEEGVGFEMLATPPKMAMAAAAAYPQVRHSIRPCCHLCLWHESHEISRNSAAAAASCFRQHRRFKELSSRCIRSGSRL